METLAKEVLNALQGSRACLFLGSGISRASGVPTVRDVYKCVFGHLFDARTAKELVTAYSSRRIPFEGFVQRIVTLTKDESLFDLFDSVAPNTKHRVIAELLHRKSIDLILTTNFDTLIEQEISKLGWEEGRDYRVFRNEGDLKRLRRARGRKVKPVLIKLHGCITDHQSVRVTLKSIASHSNIGVRLNALNRVLLDRELVVFFGYSFSDRYDVNIELRRRRSSVPAIWVVQHASGRVGISKSEVILNELNRKCLVYEADTDALFGVWSKSLGVREVPVHVDSKMWTLKVENYFNGLGPFRVALVAGEILFMIGRSAEARSHFEKAAGAVSTSTDQREKILALQSLAKTYLEMRSPEGNAQARELLQKGHVLAKRRKEATMLAMIEHHLGIERMLSKDPPAIDHFKEARRLYASQKGLLEMAKEDMQIGTMHRQSGRNELALRYYRKSLAVRRRYGDIEGVGLCYHGIGNTYYQMSRLAEAEGMYTRMLKWYQSNYEDDMRVTDAKYLLVKLWNEWGVSRPLMERYLSEVLVARARSPSKEKYVNAVLEKVTYLCALDAFEDVDMSELKMVREFYTRSGMRDEEMRANRLWLQVARS